MSRYFTFLNSYTTLDVIGKSSIFPITSKN